MNSIRRDFISKSSSSILSDRIPVWLVAIAVFGMVVIWSFFLERRIYFDDFGLFNPIYTFVVNDVISYPAHNNFENMLVHPPTNYILKGFFIKQGIPIPYALSLPAFILLLTIIVLVLKSKFSIDVKMGLLFGGLAGSMIAWVLLFAGGGVGGAGGLGASRPDLEFAFALFAGLIALESGRINNWDLKRLAIGAFLLTYASGIHYPAMFSFMGIIVYLGFALKVNRSHGKRVAIIILLGVLVFAIPFFLLWVIPDFEDITAWLATPSFKPADIPMGALEAHIATYEAIFNTFSQSIVASILFFPLKIGIPVVLISTLILFVRKETRLMAIAALPTQLFVLLILEWNQDHSLYYFPELILYSSAIVILAIVAIRFLVAKANRFWPKWNTLVNPLIAIGLVVLLIFGTGIQHAELTTQPRPDELTIARAAGKSIVGQDALVGLQGGKTYIYGESHWVNLVPYVVQTNNFPSNATGFFSKFDAIGIDSLFSYVADNPHNKSLISYYIDQTLELKGFYFSSRHNPTLSYMLFNTDQSTPIEGYALLKDWSVIHFEEKESGNYVFVTAVCDGGDYLPGANLIPSLFDNAYLLPGRQTNLKVFISTASEYDSNRSIMDSKCSILDEIRMVGQKENYHDLVNVLQNDKPIQFYNSFYDMRKTAQEKGIEFDDMLNHPEVPILPDSAEPRIGNAPPMQLQVTAIVTLSMVAVFLGLILWRWPHQITSS